MNSPHHFARFALMLIALATTGCTVSKLEGYPFTIEGSLLLPEDADADAVTATLEYVTPVTHVSPIDTPLSSLSNRQPYRGPLSRDRGRVYIDLPISHGRIDIDLHGEVHPDGYISLAVRGGGMPDTRIFFALPDSNGRDPADGSLSYTGLCLQLPPEVLADSTHNRLNDYVQLEDAALGQSGWRVEQAEDP